MCCIYFSRLSLGKSCSSMSPVSSMSLQINTLGKYCPTLLAKKVFFFSCMCCHMCRQSTSLLKFCSYVAFLQYISLHVAFGYPCSTFIADQLFSSSMFLDMTLKLIVPWNSYSALLAVKWLFTNMCLQMYLQVFPQDKSSLTLLANKRFVSGMCSLCKSWTTLDAAKWLFSSMFAHIKKIK